METPSWWYRWSPSVSMGDLPWTRLGEELCLAAVRIHLQGKSLPGKDLIREDSLRGFRYNLL